VKIDKRALALSVASVAGVVGLAFGVQCFTQPMSERYATAMARGYRSAEEFDADAAADEAVSASVIDAGYRWAASQGIDRLSECDGRPAGFRRGCAEYLNDQNEGTALVRPYSGDRPQPGKP
jgi:hypothetical protein